MPTELAFASGGCEDTERHAAILDYSARMVIEAVRPPSFGEVDQEASDHSQSRWGIRKRSVLSAVVVVTFSLLIGGAFLLLVLESSLIATARRNLAVRARAVAPLRL